MPEKIKLPPRPFLYTLDQIAMLLDIEETTLMKGYVFFVGRSSGVKKAGNLTARNIAGPDQKPDWRVAEDELLRWMKNRGFKYIDGGKVR